jgi:histidinol-phosphate aminotransferase
MTDIHTSTFHPSRFADKLAGDTLLPSTPIHLPHQERICKLDAHECTRRPPDRVIEALRRWIDEGMVQWYPDNDAVHLRTALAKYTGLPYHSIGAFNGSNEALMYIARTFIEPGAEVLVVPPTHGHLRRYTETCGGQIKRVITDDIFAADTKTVLAAIGPQTCMVYLANPNDPTGVLYTRDQIESIVRERPGTGFIIDEAFHEFSGITVAPLIKKYSNLIITRSFSFAFGLAGIRLGYVLAQPRILETIESVRAGNPVGMPAQIAGVAALEAIDDMRAYVQDVAANMKQLWTTLSSLGMNVISSPANFILVKVARPEAAVKYLADKLIFVRSCDSLSGLEGFLRITVGDRAATARVLSAFLLMPQKILGPVKIRRRFTLIRPPEGKPVKTMAEHPAIDRIISDLALTKQGI